MGDPFLLNSSVLFSHVLLKSGGKLVGAGTFVIGVAIIAFGALLFAFEKTQLDRYSILGTAVLIAGIAVGISISFYAMKKYNKGIF